MLVIGLWSLVIFPVPAARAVTHYVSLSGGNSPPYTNWATAATNIQYAIDVCSSGDVVIVTNGIYNTGGRVVYGAMSNRVAITNPISVQSVNGPEVTIIQGMSPVSNNAMRCAYVGTNATLIGFTLTNGATCTSGDLYKEQSGGGIWCDVGGVVRNCVLSGNSAYESGGGAYQGTLNNCMLSDNSVSSSHEDKNGGGASYSTLNNCTVFGNTAPKGGGVSRCTLTNCTLSDNSAIASYGGGAYFGVLNSCTVYGNSASLSGGGTFGGTLNNCTVSGNSAYEGGGTYDGTLNNCIVYFNTALLGPNYSLGTLRYCCTTPIPSGTGNITKEPRLASTSHIGMDSPCLGKGSATYMSGVDLDGEVWRTPPSIGADEPYELSATGGLSVAIGAIHTKVAAGFELPLTALIVGRVTRSVWDFGDVSGLTNYPHVSHSWAMTGSYAVVLTAWNADHSTGVSCTTMVSVVEQPILYVSVSNLTPLCPYDSWETAATNIQQAIAANSTPGRLVLVMDGVYDTGGTVVYGAMTNRIVLTNSVTLRSVNGPKVTIIRGNSPAGASAVRCAYVGKNSVLAGFTLTNGATLTSGERYKERAGGGVYCDIGGQVSNCTLSGNSANEGGGAFGGKLNNCTLSRNSAFLNGGGTYQGTLKGCTLVDNSATNGSGGGANQCTLNNCMLAGNSAKMGGGALGGKLNDCTLSGNTASSAGGGTYSSTLNNCIVYYNTAPAESNYSSGEITYCCTTPAYPRVGNTTNSPMFRDTAGGDYRLESLSPCINAGLSQEWMLEAFDLDGNPRICDGRVDMGAYEFRYEASLKGLLAGPWDETNAAIRAGRPWTNSPYAAASATVTSVPTNAVDWVLVSVRASQTGAPMASVSAFLMPDGTIRGADGGTNVYVEAKGNLYGVLQHRNHLAVMSAVPVFTNRVVTFDFSSDPNLLWGGTNAVIQVSTNKWGMIPGDADGDGTVRAVDEAIRKSQIL